MAKHKTGSGQAAVASPSDIKQHLTQLESRLEQIRELMQDGVPYLDALKVKAELGLKETIRNIFGQNSQEFQVLRKHKIDITSNKTIEKTAAILQGLIEYFEFQQKNPTDSKKANSKSPLEFAKDAQKALDLIHNPPPPPKPSTATKAAPSREPQAKPTPVPSNSVKSKPKTPPSEGVSSKLPQADSPNPIQPELNMPALSTSSQPIEAASPATQTGEPRPTPSATPEPQISMPIRNVHNQQFLDKPHNLASSPTTQGNQTMTPPTSIPQTTPLPETTSMTWSDSLELIRKICQRFHPVIRQFRERSENRPPFEIEDEHDIRDMVRAMLYLEFDDVGIEEWSAPSLNGAIQRDFLIQPGNIVMFVTRTRSGLGAKEISNLWTSACAHYASHPYCQRLVGFIYDPEGRIANPRRLEESLTSQGAAGKVEIQIFPK